MIFGYILPPPSDRSDLTRLLNQTTKEWHTRSVTLSETKGLAVRFFAEFILSEAEGLRMTRLTGHVVQCTNVVWFDLDGDNLRHRGHRGILKNAGLRSVRLHDLRHTFASLLIQNGESLAYVKEQLGHHSIQITVDTYGHLVPGGNRQAVDRLDDPQDTLPHATIRNLDATTPLDAVLATPVSA